MFKKKIFIRRHTDGRFNSHRLLFVLPPAINIGGRGGPAVRSCRGCDTGRREGAPEGRATRGGAGRGRQALGAGVRRRPPALDPRAAGARRLAPSRASRRWSGPDASGPVRARPAPDRVDARHPRGVRPARAGLSGAERRVQGAPVRGLTHPPSLLGGAGVGVPGASTPYPYVRDPYLHARPIPHLTPAPAHDTDAHVPSLRPRHPHARPFARPAPTSLRRPRTAPQDSTSNPRSPRRV